MRHARKIWALLILSAGLAFGAKDSCTDCHSVLGGPLQSPVSGMPNDIHKRFGFSCADCHGGNPSADDPGVAMNRSRGFLGKPARTTIPKFCARCHADAALMHRYEPQQRVDQYAQYVTSIHGQRIASGDGGAAVCTDCHSVHDIRGVKDSLSPVHPLRLPETCARCHAEPQYMAKYKIPTDQFADYRKSVHWEALEKRGDLSAPSCATCHGNHGATPPGVSSVSAICGTCHVLMENLYAKSPHQAAFAGMGVGACTTCHGNHAVLKTSSAMLVGPDAVCSNCHEATSKGGLAAAQMGASIAKLRTALERSEAKLDQASKAGMEVSEAIIKQSDAKETLVKARVAVHAFQPDAVEIPVKEGLGIAAGTYQAGVGAMQERARRRVGLGVSLVAILITMAGLWMAIRRLERRAP